MAPVRRIVVKDRSIVIVNMYGQDYISLTDMLKAKDGEFFISDWLRNKNTLEFLGIWESVYNPGFNYGEFALIKNKSGVNRFKTVSKNGQTAPTPLELKVLQGVMGELMPIRISPSNSVCG
jgi:hypothetical protein